MNKKTGIWHWWWNKHTTFDKRMITLMIYWLFFCIPIGFYQLFTLPTNIILSNWVWWILIFALHPGIIMLAMIIVSEYRDLCQEYKKETKKDE